MRTIPMSGRILALAVLILSLGLPVEAQLAKILRETNLTQDDMKLANGAAQSLFEKSGVARGQQASWQNPESGATGVVEVLDLEQGGKCITVRCLVISKFFNKDTVLRIDSQCDIGC